MSDIRDATAVEPLGRLEPLEASKEPTEKSEKLRRYSRWIKVLGGLAIFTVAGGVIYAAKQLRNSDERTLRTQELAEAKRIENQLPRSDNRPASRVPVLDAIFAVQDNVTVHTTCNDKRGRFLLWHNNTANDIPRLGENLVAFPEIITKEDGSRWFSFSIDQDLDGNLDSKKGTAPPKTKSNAALAKIVSQTTYCIKAQDLESGSTLPKVAVLSQKDAPTLADTPVIWGTRDASGQIMTSRTGDAPAAVAMAFGPDQLKFYEAYLMPRVTLP